MLYVFFGTDSGAARTHAKVRAGETNVLRITPDTYDEQMLSGALGGADMFGVAHTLILDGILSDALTKESFATLVPHCAESETDVIMIEGALDATNKRLLEKHGAKLSQHDAPKERAERADFSLAQSFADKKRAAAWVAYERALLLGTAPEAIHGMVFWKLKQIINGNTHRSRESVRALLPDAAELPLIARERGVELEYALERFLLER